MYTFTFYSGFLRKLENAPTLYQALQRLVRMVSAEASHLRLGIQERRDDILFHTEYSSVKGMPGYTSSQAYQLEVYLELIRHFVGKNWVPDEIGIEYPIVPTVVKEHFAGARVMTNQRVGYIAVPRSYLHVSARGNGREDRGDEEPVILTKQFDYVETTRALLKPYLSQGYPSAQLAASLMDTSLRTFARRLSDARVTYRELVDGLRFDAARKLMQDPTARVADIASAVGFDDQAHFARMFRRIAGLSPRDFRKIRQ